LWVQSSAMPAIIQPQINKAPYVRVIVICSDHRLLWQDSYKGVNPALTSGVYTAQDYYYVYKSYKQAIIFILKAMYRKYISKHFPT